MRPTIMFTTLLLAGLSIGLDSEASTPTQKWHDNYRDAATEAKTEGKMLLIVFCAEGDATKCDCLEEKVLDDPKVRVKLNDYACLRVPLDVMIGKGDKKQKLIDYPSLSEMHGRQGMAIIDYAHKDAEYYETVVSCFPMLNNKPYSADKMLTILGLPSGTLTQRTLIYAVRIHPEHPASTEGQLSPILVKEAQSHSIHQASIRLQGHHNWENRFHRINGKLGNGLTACEVCAESWPGEGLLEGAIECVRCWRYSSGHWSAVRARHRCYGYDIRRGSNRIWYATGIFGSRR